MRQVRLSPEAFGTLLAMRRIAKIRFYDPQVATELAGNGLAEIKEGVLTITRAGKTIPKQAKAAQKLLTVQDGRRH